MTKPELSAITQVKLLANDLLDKKENVGKNYTVKDLFLDAEIITSEIIAECEAFNLTDIQMYAEELKFHINNPTTAKELNNCIDATMCRILET